MKTISTFSISNLECGGKRSATPLWINLAELHASDPKRRRRPDELGLCRRTPYLPDANESLNRLNQFLGVIAHTVFENDFDVFDVGDLCRRIAFDDHQVGLFAHRD